MSLEIIDAYGHTEVIKALFAEYTGMLLANDPSFVKYLRLQRYDDELEHLHIKYGKPAGRLYLARFADSDAGCIGLRKLDEKRSEMKRLYVRPEFRGKGIARALVNRIISDARAVGYSQLLLDTLPCLSDAIRLYRQCGFYEIGAYNDSPVKETLFMQLDL